MLMTQIVREDTKWADDTTSPTYKVRVRLGYNWGTYLFVSYNPRDLEPERTDATPRTVGLDGNVPVAITIGDHTYEIICIS